MNNYLMGLGIDIENIERFKKLSFEKNTGFYKRVFSKEEIKYCLSKSKPEQHFAGKFCAKEAFLKATNKETKDYKKIVVRNKEGKPEIDWPGLKVYVSVSHTIDKAIAMVNVFKL